MPSYALYPEGDLHKKMLELEELRAKDLQLYKDCMRKVRENCWGGADEDLYATRAATQALAFAKSIKLLGKEIKRLKRQAKKQQKSHVQDPAPATGNNAQNLASSTRPPLKEPGSPNPGRVHV